MFPGLIVDLAAPVVGAPVGLGDFPENTAGISRGDGVGRNISGNYAAGADHHVIPDMYAGKNHGVAAHPYIVADGDADAVLIHGVPGLRMHRMAGCVDGYIGGKLAVVADGHFGHIQNRTVVVGEEPFATSMWEP